MTPRRTRDFDIGPFAHSATQWLDEAAGRPEPSVPVRAATVVLVRGAPVEVFMIERTSTMDFAPSTWVFPGGRVDPEDARIAEDPARLVLAPGGPQSWARRLHLDEVSAAAVLGCAFREVFEEAGVLLASRRPEGPLAATAGAEWAKRRADLEAHRLSFSSLLHDLYLRADLLEVVDRWVTPEFERRRFDTWFFVAPLSMAAEARAVSRESTAGRWVAPQDMLAEHDSGDVRLLPPTLTALQRLARCHSAAEVAEQARHAEFETTRPRAVRGPNGLYLQAEVNA